MVALLLSVFIVIVIDRVLTLRIAAERNGVEHLVGTLRSALGLEVVVRLTKGKGLEDLQYLDGVNPVLLLDWPPVNYLGELDRPDPAEVPGYSWYFDTARKLLVYRVEHGEYLESALPGPARIRFAVRFDFDDRNGDGVFNPGEETVRGVSLVPAEPYRWKTME